MMIVSTYDDNDGSKSFLMIVSAFSDLSFHIHVYSLIISSMEAV